METPEDSDIENSIESDVEVMEDPNDDQVMEDSNNDQAMQEDRGEHENEEGGAENQVDETVSKPEKPKRVIRNPQPKLNAERLKGNRGLTAVASYFDRVKFKGPGHEEEDLSVILKTYEYWCHRLFPRYPFDECIAKIEQLGKKRAVVTHIKKIRLDMINDDQPIIPNDDDLVTEDIGNLDTQFDGLLDDVPRGPIESASGISDQELERIRLNEERAEPSLEISEEQLERIRLNKERAEQKRRERLRKKMESSILSQEIESQNLNSSEVAENEIDNSTQSSLLVSAQSDITEEQIMEKIRLNKEKAEQRRRERLQEKTGLVTSQDQSQTLHSNLENEVCTNSSESIEKQMSSELSQLHTEKEGNLGCDSSDNFTQADDTEIATSSNSQSEIPSQEIDTDSSERNKRKRSTDLSPLHTDQDGNLSYDNTVSVTEASHTEIATSSNSQSEVASQEHSSEKNLADAALHEPLHNQENNF